MYDFVEDPDNADSTFIFTVIGGQNVTASIVGTAAIFKASANWYGVDSALVIVSDGEFSDTTKAYLTVHSVNDAPLFTGVPDTVEFVNTSTLILDMDDWVNDNDFPNDSLRWEFTVSDDTLKWVFDPDSYELTLSTGYFWGNVVLRFTATDDSAAEAMDSLIVKILGDPTSIANLGSQIPTSYVLNQNYPNPFNPLTHIKFGLPTAGKVSIILYNVLGQEVAKLLEANKSAGYHVLDFDASHLPSGLYFYRIQADNFAEVKKMVLMK